MVPATYLVGSLIVMSVWFVLFICRKDVRKEMLVMSSIVAIWGVVMEAFFWTKDWWTPPTVTNTLIGIEDILLGFGLGGVSAVIYEELFKKRLAPRSKNSHSHTKQLFLTIFLSILIGSFIYFVLDFTSAQAGVPAVVVPTVVILLFRRDLIVDSLATGAILTISAFLGFAVLNIIEPGFVYNWWLFENLSGIVILGVPIEDVIWFFAVGMFLGPMYEFWQGRRLQGLK